MTMPEYLYGIIQAPVTEGKRRDKPQVKVFTDLHVADDADDKPGSRCGSD